jgi:hypothetical protein
MALGLAFAIAVLDNRGTVEIRPGVDEQRLGDADNMAENIAADGPAPFQDLAGHDRHFFLQHFGDDPEDGWLAFAARPPGTPAECTIVWNEEDEVFRLLDSDDEVTEDCDGSEYPADGGDLPTYEVTVRDDNIYVDPRSDER